MTVSKDFTPLLHLYPMAIVIACLPWALLESSGIPLVK